MAVLEKNQLHSAVIEDYTSEGLGVCRIDGRAVFVRGAVRGDRCVIRVLKAPGGRGAVWANIERVEEPSPHRERGGASCAVFPACGGCDCRHMSYDEELYFKRRHAEQTLARIGGVTLTAEEILPAPRDAYRNKALIPVAADAAGRAVTGFYRARSNTVAPFQSCPAAMPQINACAAALREWIDRNGVPIYDAASGSGLIRRLFVRVTRNGASVLAMPVLNGRLPRRHVQTLIDTMRAHCPEITGILTLENKRRDNVMLGDGPVTVLWGSETQTETLGRFEFELHPLAFAQVCARQAEKLYDRAAGYAALRSHETAADLYCGVGTLTLWLAASCERATGAEVSPRAVECARRNALRNGITNADFVCADIGHPPAPVAEAARLVSGRVDVCTADPPRAGMDAAAVDTIARLSPARLVYISCDPGTLARDVRRLAAHGYKAERLTLADMFPGTRHVECCLMLRRV